MSKYRVVVVPSIAGKWFVTATILISLIPVWLISSDLYSSVWIFQCFLSLCLMLFAIQEWRRKQNENITLVEDNGRWTSLNDEKSRPFEISEGSRVSKWLLWVQLSPLMPLPDEKCKWLWIFPDSVSKKDFRRLSRIIIRKQRTHEDESLSVR
ncbi:hypothetical protein EYS14_09705 [Alteromonadaceae bacterium M269]|nr:hypothetical protein EYS14_09705 [Alteromonadaceae bacterium M269]